MKPVTFIEAGGFHGMTVDFVLDTFKEWDIIVIEPTPSLYAELRDKYMDEERVTVKNGALWGKEEIRTFNVSGHSGSSSLERDKKNLGDIVGVDVKCIKATTLLESVEGNIVLNLNCEGAELEIMEDLLTSGAHKGVKIFIKGHKDVMPELERYDIMFVDMDKAGVDYIRNTYGAIHKGAVRQGVTLKTILERHNKPEWVEMFYEEGQCLKQ